MFNLMRFPEVKILMKCERGIPLAASEEFVKENTKVKEMLEWEFKKF